MEYGGCTNIPTKIYISDSSMVVKAETKITLLIKRHVRKFASILLDELLVCCQRFPGPVKDTIQDMLMILRQRHVINSITEDVLGTITSLRALKSVKEHVRKTQKAFGIKVWTNVNNQLNLDRVKEIWGYNEENEECEEFNYGGCKGNDNSFMTKDECSNSCKPQGYNRQMCLLPRDPGPCKDRHPKWNFDNFEKRCVPFYYGGCEGNDNRFDDLESCQMSCPKEFLQSDVCKLPQVQGPCGDYLERYYFDILEGVCKPFHYGGCDGNKNNFKSMADCQSRCSVDFSIPITPDFKLEYCFLSKDEGIEDENNPKMQKRWYYDSTDGKVKIYAHFQRFVGPAIARLKAIGMMRIRTHAFNSLGEDVKGMEIALNPWSFVKPSVKTQVVGLQGKKTPKLTYAIFPLTLDHALSESQAGILTRKMRNALPLFTRAVKVMLIAFKTRSNVIANAGNSRVKTFVEVLWTLGPVLEDSRNGTTTFVAGNGNRFSSIEECETICLLQDEIPSLETIHRSRKNEICSLDMDVGPCDDQQKRWYFSTQRQTCVPSFTRD
ncbi:Papilinlike, partial [Caligus rogercresseyi]